MSETQAVERARTFIAARCIHDGARANQCVECLAAFLSEEPAGERIERASVDALVACGERIARLEKSMVEHFQRDHLEGDGPEIDRWKRNLSAVTQAAETLAAALEAALGEARTCGLTTMGEVQARAALSSWEKVKEGR